MCAYRPHGGSHGLRYQRRETSPGSGREECTPHTPARGGHPYARPPEAVKNGKNAGRTEKTGATVGNCRTKTLYSRHPAPQRTRPPRAGIRLITINVRFYFEKPPSATDRGFSVSAPRGAGGLPCVRGLPRQGHGAHVPDAAEPSTRESSAVPAPAGRPSVPSGRKADFDARKHCPLEKLA